MKILEMPEPKGDGYKVFELPSGHWVEMRVRPSWGDQRRVTELNQDIEFTDGDIENLARKAGEAMVNVPSGGMLDGVRNMLSVVVKRWSFKGDITLATIEDTPDMQDYIRVLEVFNTECLPFLTLSNDAPKARP